MSDRKFICAECERGKYSLEEDKSLGQLCKRYKDKYDAKVEKFSKKSNYNDKMKKRKKKHHMKDMLFMLFESSIET